MIRIIKASERLKASPKINIALFGPSGVGKTTLARTLDPDTTLFVDLEAGTLAIQDWAGDVIDLRAVSQEIGAHPWEMARALSLFIGGQDPSDADGDYSKATYDQVSALVGEHINLAKYKTVFVDSITVASRECFKWSEKSPQAVSEKTGKPDTRGAYGILKKQMIRWLTHLQHAPMSVVVVGILNREEDDLKRVTWSPQVEGAATARELPGIFDEVITLQNMKADDGSMYRALVCHQQNPWGYPAKDRSGCLEMIEPPDLGALMAKIRAGKRLDTVINTSLPTQG